MSIHTPTATTLAPYDCPDDGDDVTANSVNIGLHHLGDAIADVKERGLRDVETVALSSLVTTTSTSFSDVTGLSITLTGGAVGDVLVVDFTGYGQVDASTLIAFVRVNDGANRDSIPGAATHVRENDADAAEERQCGCHFSYVLQGAGSVTVTVRFRSSSGGQVGFLGASAETSSLRAMLFRTIAS